MTYDLKRTGIFGRQYGSFLFTRLVVEEKRKLLFNISKTIGLLISSCMFHHTLTSPYSGARSHSRGARCL